MSQAKTICEIYPALEPRLIVYNSTINRELENLLYLSSQRIFRKTSRGLYIVVYIVVQLALNY
jgi:hypothetical protein